MSRRVCVSLALAVAAACHTPPGAVRSDVQAYLQHMKNWAAVEAETARTAERILATEFVDEAEVRHQIADSRPRIQVHLEQIRAYTPRTEEVQHIHDEYRRAWEDMLAAYDAIEQGFSSGDYTKLARGRSQMSAWRDGIMRVAQELGELADRVGASRDGATET